MAEYLVYFHRPGVPSVKVEGTLDEVRAYIGEIMSRPVISRKKQVLVSGAAVWPAKKGTNTRADKSAGMYWMGVLSHNGKEVRIGLWEPAPYDNTHMYLLHRNGKIAEKVDYNTGISLIRKEFKTRTQRVKTM